MRQHDRNMHQGQGHPTCLRKCDPLMDGEYAAGDPEGLPPGPLSTIWLPHTKGETPDKDLTPKESEQAETEHGGTNLEESREGLEEGEVLVPDPRVLRSWQTAKGEVFLLRMLGRVGGIHLAIGECQGTPRQGWLLYWQTPDPTSPTSAEVHKQGQAGSTPQLLITELIQAGTPGTEVEDKVADSGVPHHQLHSFHKRAPLHPWMGADAGVT